MEAKLGEGNIYGYTGTKAIDRFAPLCWVHRTTHSSLGFAPNTRRWELSWQSIKKGLDEPG